jgi:putative transposase
VDPRIVEVVSAVIAAQTTASTGTVTRLRRQAAAALAEKYGDELSLLPDSTFYRLVGALSAGRHTFGSAGHPPSDGQPARRSVHQERGDASG